MKKPKIDPVEAEIKGVASQVADLLKEHGLGMQAVIQIFKIPESPIVAAGNVETGQPMSAKEIAEALRPVGDKID